jgi:ribosomal protein L11 methyltransferase
LRSILFKPGLAPELWDALVAALWERGTAGILEEQAGMRAFFADAEIAAELAEAYRDLIAGVREESNALQSAPAVCDPILIGTRFFVVSPASDVPVPSGRIRLALDAVTAFGTGRHESTQVVMEALERLPLANATVLDVGCGSGILSLAASALGAAKVFSCDVHPDAIATAGSYVPEGRLFQGTIDAVRDSAAEIVVANISAAVIDALAPDLNRTTREDGTLVLAGFMGDRVPTSFVPERTFENNGWFCWLCRPSKREAAAGPQQARMREFAERW